MPWRNIKTSKRNRESGGRRARGQLLLFIGQLGKVLMKKRLRKIRKSDRNLGQELFRPQKQHMQRS